MCTSPCLNCTERKVGCHCDCRKYYIYKRDKALEYLAREFALTDERIVLSFKEKQIEKQRRRANNRG